MILGIDQGTTGSTCLVFDAEGRPRGRAYAVLTTAARIGEYESIRVVRRADDTAVLSGQLN